MGSMLLWSLPLVVLSPAVQKGELFTYHVLQMALLVQGCREAVVIQSQPLWLRPRNPCAAIWQPDGLHTTVASAICCVLACNIALDTQPNSPATSQSKTPSPACYACIVPQSNQLLFYVHNSDRERMAEIQMLCMHTSSNSSGL